MHPPIDLAPSRPLTPSDAAVAILHTADRRYLLQHRDAKQTIFYPGHWGCFGGALEKGETPLQALQRELREELEFDLQSHRPSLFSRFRFSVEPAGIDALDRYYYDVLIEPGIVERMTLGEGAGMELVDGAEALHQRRLVPYDGFALWLHYYKNMLSPATP